MTTPKDPAVAARLAKNRQIALNAGRRLARCDPGEEVVISGIAGVFPDSDNVKHFGENLLSKKDLISDDDRRWKLEHPEIPQRTGKLNEVKKFDAAFFGVHYKQAQTMDPMSRILLEKSYEAVVDAGYNPKHMKGSKTGVFIGACFSESEKTWFYEKIQIDGFGITGCSRAMLANRISYWMGINGPSYTVDSACSSSLYALEHAYKAIRDGVCDAALVGGCNLCLHPYVSLQFARLGVLSPDGRCKSFDEGANGYCRSEAVVVVLLQKLKNSRRVYCRLVHAKTNCDGYKEQGITYPSGQMQQRLLEEFYEECEVEPNDLSFIEAHGTGTKVGDPEEVKALETVFCPQRTEPLKIGSVKSNIGHSEPASGLCSVAKVILGFELGYIPPNINLKTLRSDIDAFHNGKIIVVTEPTEWEGGLAGVNSFGFGGANCHVLLNSNQKLKINNALPEDDLPRLIVASGRTKEAVDVILSDCESRTVDVEFVRLLQAIHCEDIPGHIYRGYTLRKKDVTEPVREIEYYPGDDRPVWFVFAGMGSQWTTMGKAMMKLPMFAETINKCHQILKSKGVDLLRIVTSDDPKTFDNILNSFVGIAAIQIALVDVLHLLGIVPDGIIGHSVGELGCAYADGCLTAEQMMLAAYYRGLASLETDLIHGSMMSVGLGYETARFMVPPEIDIACHNCYDSCTISGPSEDVKKFGEALQKKEVFAKEVKVSNIAYHSRYIAKAGPKLLEYMKKVIPEPKARSKKWISTSVVETEWNTEKAKYSSAEYYTNNLLNPVLFEEGCVHIPGNAIAIEIAPHGLLQAILNRSLRKDVINIPLMKRNHEDNLDFFMCALGKIFDGGLNPQLEKLYPPVSFPVSKGTPMIAPLIRWEHSEDWYVTSYQMQEKIKSGERTVVITLKDDELEYLSGHVVDGRNLYPATGYLMLAWETVALMRGELYSEVPVVFENVRFNRATNIPKEGNIDFIVMVQKGSGNFEVVEGGAAIVTGRIYVPEDVNKECVNMPPIEDKNDDPSMLPLSSRDVYKELRLRGYNYKGLFRGITYANNEGSCGRIQWVNNFVAFMDTMLQMQILQEDTRGLFVPTSLQKMVINTKKHFNVLHTLDPEKPEFPVHVYKEIDLIACGGIEVRNLRASAISRKKPLGEPVLEKFQFIPHISAEPRDITEIVRICTHIALESVPSLKVKTVELIDSFTNVEGPLISEILVNVLGDLPLIQADIVVLANNEHPLITEELTGLTVEDKKLPGDQSALLVVATQILGRKDVLQTCLNSLREGAFILTREPAEEKFPFKELGLDVCFNYTVGNEKIFLIRKCADPGSEFVVIKVTSDTFSWVPDVQKALANINIAKKQKLILYAEKEKFNGILGFFNCVRKETNGEYARCYFIMDDTAPAFSVEHPLYKTQLAKDLALNVYKRGTWGSYRHLLLENIGMVQTPHAYVNTLVKGDLTTLRWIEGSLNPYKHVGADQLGKQILVHIYYAPLNFRDVMLATGKLASEVIIKSRIEQECVQGFEFAGKTSDGRRWMGMESCKTMATMVKSGNVLLWPVPDQWTLEEASTVPVVYGTVLYALIQSGNMQRGERVLIHAGTGGVGQAAINVCLYYECEIFTTVGTPEKREFIRTHFPSIPESHIGNSRDTSFEQLVMKETNGEGVDLVLNSLAEEKLQASVRCLGRGGRFLEIGKFDLAKNNMLSMEHFLKQISFHGVMLDNLFYADFVWQKELNVLLSDHIDKGAVKPLIRTVFNADEVEAAFRYMAAGKHVGKVLLKVRDEEEDRCVPPEILLREAVPRFICQEDTSYIICGGLGGFGLELADWLVLRGARKLVLTSRKGVTTGYQAMRIRIWKSYGTTIVVSTDDITTEEGVRNLINTANSLGPVTVIFNLAVVLQDALFEDQTEETFTLSAGPKAQATLHLDKLSRELCPHLEQFVIFSSVSCGRGNQGQTNYGFSNSVMERICEARRADNLPALAIQWGAIGEVGLVADMAEENLEVVIGGTLQQRITSCLEVMDYFLKQEHPVVASMVVAEKRSGGSGSGTIVDTVANILGLKDLKTVSLHSTLAELGMDSMMGVEIKQTLEREFEVFLTPQDIRSLTFAKLYEIAAASENPESDKGKGAKKIEDGNLIASEMGMNYFMRLIGDEILAAKPILRIPSLYQAGSTVEVPVQDHPTVFVLPGVEGIATVMEPLAAPLNVQVLCLQYSHENPPPTIRKVAESLIIHITSRLPKNQEFHLIGYSFGGLVAMEVVRILEAEGRKGRLWMIDSSPSFLKDVTRFSLLNSPEDVQNQVQVKIITRFLDLIWPQASKELTNDLVKLNDWNARLDHILALTPPDIPHSKKYQRALMNAGYCRVSAVLLEEWTEENYLKAATTLIRPTEISLQTTDDYGLSQFFVSPVKVLFVDGNHFTILENKKTAELVMEGTVLQENLAFKKIISGDDAQKKAMLLSK